jgi:hypothetical protein
VNRSCRSYPCNSPFPASAVTKQLGNHLKPGSSSHSTVFKPPAPSYYLVNTITNFLLAHNSKTYVSLKQNDQALLNTGTMGTRTLMLVLTSLVSANAFKLLVASYEPENGTTGALQTLAYNHSNATLQVTHTNQDCGALPSWLDVSSDRCAVTCVNEGVPGSLTKLGVQCDGSLKVLSNTSTLGGPVSNVYFGNESAVALAHVS